MTKKRAIGYTLAGLVLLSIGSGLGKGDGDPSSTPSSSATDPASAIQTPEATPTPAPTPRITDEPGTPYLTWIARSGYYGDISDYYTDLVDAATAEDVDAVIIAASNLGDAIDTELDWLSRHQPQSCWKELYDLDVSALTLQGSAAHAFETYWRDWPYGSDADFNNAISDMDHGSRLTTEVTDLIGRVCQ